MIHQDVKKELEELDRSMRALRHFGLFLFAALGAVTGVLIWRNDPLWHWSGVVSLILLAAAICVPGAYRFPYRYWMICALGTGWLMTRVLLSLAYLLVVTPIGWLVRFSGKDIIDQELERGAQSYWKRRDPADDAQRWRKQF